MRIGEVYRLSVGHNTATLEVIDIKEYEVQVKNLETKSTFWISKINMIDYVRISETKQGKKDSKTEKKPNIFTYCQVNKLAIIALAERMQLGHEKYEEGLDYENFKRVENADFEYANAMFRHALGVGEDSELEHLVAQAWNSVARLQIYLEGNEINKG